MQCLVVLASNGVGALDFRAEEMQEKLQTTMDELSAP